jgi:Tfp pilus assembly protein PilN
LTTLQSKIDAEEAELNAGLEHLQQAERDVQNRQQALQQAVQEYHARRGWVEKMRELARQMEAGEVVLREADHESSEDESTADSRAASTTADGASA